MLTPLTYAPSLLSHFSSYPVFSLFNSFTIFNPLLSQIHLRVFKSNSSFKNTYAPPLHEAFPNSPPPPQHQATANLSSVCLIALSSSLLGHLLNFPLFQYSCTISHQNAAFRSQTLFIFLCTGKNLVVIRVNDET